MKLDNILNLNDLKKNRILVLLCFMFSTNYFLTSCISKPKKSRPIVFTDTDDMTKPPPMSKDRDTSSSDVYVSGSNVSFSYSLSNNSMTSQTVNQKKAQSAFSDLKRSLKAPKWKDRKDLLASLSIGAIGGVGLGDVLAQARKLIDVELRKDIKKELPDYALLQIALNALRARKLSLAEHFIFRLEKSKNRQIKAAAYTAEGLIALIDKKEPEAIAAWEDALKANPGFKAALLNIGFLSLKYGDYRTAKKRLGNLRNDWFALYGLAVAARLEGNPNRASSICHNLLSKKPDYKPAIFTCALNEYQGKKNYKEAKEMLNKMLKSGRGSPIIDEKAYKIIEKIEREESEDRRKKAQMKIEKARKAAEARRKKKQAEMVKKAKAKADAILKD